MSRKFLLTFLQKIHKDHMQDAISKFNHEEEKVSSY